ncbi:pyruvate, phosphate dikinase [Paraconexibacter algicola]|uniref:pyruvate, phosphate dikinase n=1 Tax=Paraconexibacter algicola TaxID=2133960 RepID=UPI001304BEB6|nr:pyruvate, phosphate dikinase [Paraconexibacter algicola]
MPATSVTVVPFDAEVAADKALLGGKGAGLVAMVALGLPVPPGFVVGTDAGRAYLADGALTDELRAAVDAQLDALERRLDRRLGDPSAPLFVSVRSGAPVSMPGMMDTILNVGLNDELVEALAQQTQDPAFAWTSYVRLLHTFATTVRGLSEATVEDALFDALPDGPDDGARTARGEAAVLRDLLAREGDPFPADPREQVRECLGAVFSSWRSPRAIAYREHRGIDEAMGTACVVQAMVFGNRGEDSGSGVAFSRDPATGEPGVYGDVLFDAQGEDVVAGVADPLPLTALEDRLPDAARAVADALALLEREERDLVECEFTIEQGRLWILQYRRAQRSGRAAVRVAVDLVDEGVLEEREAGERLTDAQLAAAHAPRFADAASDGDVLARGCAASPGAGVGTAVFDAHRAAALKEQGRDVVLVRPTTSPSDIHGFIASVAIVTGRGGRTSHAAVVARGMDRPAVCGVGEVRISGAGATVDGVAVQEGDLLAVDGDRGIVSRVAPALADPEQDERLQRLLAWRAAS